jgi:cellulase
VPSYLFDVAPRNGECAKVDKTQLSFFKIDGISPTGYPESTRFSRGDPQEQTGKSSTDIICCDSDNVHPVAISS